MIGVLIALAWASRNCWRDGVSAARAGGVGGAVVFVLSAAAWTRWAIADSVTLLSRRWRSRTGIGLPWAAWGFLLQLGQHRKAIRYLRKRRGSSRRTQRCGTTWASPTPDSASTSRPSDTTGIVADPTGECRDVVQPGVSYATLGQYPQAIRYFQEASRIKPDHAEAWYNLGVSSTTLGQHQQAIGYYRESLRIQPENAERGTTWLLLRQTRPAQQAIVCYRESLRIQPENAEARSNLGVAIGELERSRSVTVSSYAFPSAPFCLPDNFFPHTIPWKRDFPFRSG